MDHHRFTLRMIAGGVCALCAVSAAAQDETGRAIREFQTEHAGAQTYIEEGEVRAVYGRAFATGDSPEESVEHFLSRHVGIIAPDLGELRALPGDAPGSIVRGVMYDAASDTYRFSLISFEQTRAGIPVFRSRIGFLMRNEPGFPMVLAGWNARDLSGFTPGRQRPDPASVSAVARAAAAQRLGVHDVTIEGEPLLVIFPGGGDARLAVGFVASRGSHATYPDYSRELIVADAASGEILFTESQIHHFTDVAGNVSGLATDGWQSGDCDPQSLMGMPYAEVSIQGGERVYADVNGDFVIPHGGFGEVAVESRLRGPWFWLFDLQNNHTPLLTMNVTPPGPAHFIHNASNSEFSRANVDCYLHANLVRDYVLSLSPNFPVIAGQRDFRILTNAGQSCNAYYNGHAITFLIADPEMCANSGFSSVVYHEYGHHLVETSGNGQDQFGEGSSDALAVLVMDQPDGALGLFECDEPVRSAVNDIQYPCFGQGYECAGLLSGAVWETRNELIITEPIDYRDILGSLFINMLIVRGGTHGENGTRITPFITLLFLTLDDDDGDIGNGTPHYVEIGQGFGEHGLDAPSLDITYIEDLYVVVGEHQSGDLGDIAASDDAYFVTRSGFGSTFIDLHNMEMLVQALTSVQSAATIDLRIESRSSDPGGTASIRLHNWNTGEYDAVGTYAVGTSDAVQTIADIPAGSFIDAEGALEVQIKYLHFVPFMAFTFDSFFDEIHVTVE